MRLAFFESILTPGGHEVEFDRILVEEISALGHEVIFYVPEGYVFKHNYGVPVRCLPGEAVSYAGASRLEKVWLAAKREINRQRWYRELYRQAAAGEFDAILTPTATYRYLRAVRLSPLKNSPVPVIFMILGVTPAEGLHFFPQAENMLPYKNIKIAVQTLTPDILGRTLPNVHCVKPPAYVPRDIDFKPAVKAGDTLKLGFFGQYRKEKNLDSFLDIYLSCDFPEWVSILVQGHAIRQEDAVDFKRLQGKYAKYPSIHFLDKPLNSQDWQQAIAGVDALIMPYAAPRYRYHGSGMLLTALGFYKPVVLTDDISPEILANYDVGVSFTAGSSAALKKALRTFVLTFRDKAAVYQQELERVNADLAPRKMAEFLLNLAKQ